MEQSITLPLIVDEEGLWLSFEARLDPEADLDWDRDAIVTRVRAEVGAFHGSFTTVIWSHELVTLYLKLMDIWHHFGPSVQHQVTFQEGTVQISIAVSHTGGFTVTIELRDDPSTDTIFRFTLSPEYMTLAYWLQTLYAVLTIFPPQVPVQALPAPPPGFFIKHLTSDRVPSNKSSSGHV